MAKQLLIQWNILGKYKIKSAVIGQASQDIFIDIPTQEAPWSSLQKSANYFFLLDLNSMVTKQLSMICCIVLEF